MQKLGVLDVIIPLIFAFTITFALLNKLNLFGKNNSRYSAVIALAMGFFFVYYVDFVDVLFFTSYVTLFIIASLGYLLIVNFLGIENVKTKWVLYVVFAFFVILIGSRFVDWEIVMKVVLNPAVILFAVMIGCIWFVTYAKKEKKPEKAKLSKEDKEFSKKYLEEQRPKRDYPKGGILLREKEPL
ncbi:hypothetical protein KY316_03810 [Candidatus Woesearchaeota archaeon]|nr:hypothetical protein [Candidatus Woesearchaeota archaeon]